MNLARFRIVPMLLVMGAIFFLSHQPGNELHLPAFPGSDKVAHCIAYTVLGLTVILAHKKKSWLEKTRNVSLTTVLATLLYGISDEFHQYFIPGRYPSIADIVADTLGGLITVLFFSYMVKRYHRLAAVERERL